MKNKQSLNILKVWSTFQTEIKYHDHYLAKSMHAKGHTTTFFASDGVEPAWKPFLKQQHFDTSKIEIWEGSTIRRFPSISISAKPFIKNPFAFYKAIKSLKPSVIHLLGISYPVNQLAIVAAFFASKAPIIVNEHGVKNENRTGLVARFFYWHAYIFYQLFGKKRIQHFVAPNEESKAFIISRYGVKEDKISIIPLGFDSTVFYLQENLRDNSAQQLIIGFAGKIFPDKRVDRILKAINQSKYKSNIRCIIAGFNASNEAIKHEMISFAMENKIDLQCKGFLNTRELAIFYNAIDLAVYPGVISITTIEANACGTPILLNDSIQGLENRVEEGRGFLFKTDEELVQLINHYYEAKANNKINHHAIAKATERYSWDNLSQEYLNLYEQFL